MSLREYQSDLLSIIGQSDVNISQLARATGHGRDYIRDKLSCLPYVQEGASKKYALCDAARRLYPGD
jgi:hypothetical protein